MQKKFEKRRKENKKIERGEWKRENGKERSKAKKKEKGKGKKEEEKKRAQGRSET